MQETGGEGDIARLPAIKGWVLDSARLSPRLSPLLRGGAYSAKATQRSNKLT